MMNLAALILSRPVTAVTAVLLSTMFLGHAGAATIELKAGCTNGKGDPLCDVVDRFAENVHRESKGEIVVRNLYTALGQEQGLAQAVMSGSVDIGMMSDGNSSKFTDAYQIYSLPFLFKNVDNLMKSLDTPTGKAAIARFESDLGVKFLFAVSQGVGRDIQTRNKSLKVPADVAGLKIRTTASPIELAIYKAWGANPTPFDWTQTFAALQQGVLDGMNIHAPSVIGAKMYEVTKHSVHINYQIGWENLFINAKKFSSLSAAHQRAILAAAAETRPWSDRYMRDAANKALVELPKLGTAVYMPTPSEYEQWAAIRERVWSEVAEKMPGKIDLELAKKIQSSQ